MRSRIRISSQVEDFVKALAPEPRTRLTRGLKGLEKGAGDTKMLEGGLAGYSRLRVGGYRVIFAERAQRGERIIDSIFVERRSIVYEMFEKILAEQLRGGTPE